MDGDGDGDAVPLALAVYDGDGVVDGHTWLRTVTTTLSSAAKPSMSPMYTATASVALVALCGNCHKNRDSVSSPRPGGRPMGFSICPQPLPMLLLKNGP